MEAKTAIIEDEDCVAATRSIIYCSRKREVFPNREKSSALAHHLLEILKEKIHEQQVPLYYCMKQIVQRRRYLHHYGDSLLSFEPS